MSTSSALFDVAHPLPTGTTIGPDQIIHGDQVGGDKVGGDKLTVGDIANSSGVAIGQAITQNVGYTPEQFADLVTRILGWLQANPQTRQQLLGAKADLQVTDPASLWLSQFFVLATPYFAGLSTALTLRLSRQLLCNSFCLILSFSHSCVIYERAVKCKTQCVSLLFIPHSLLILLPQPG